MNFDRQARLWRVRETEYCLFHLEPPLDENEDLVTVIADADARHQPRHGRAASGGRCLVATARHPRALTPNPHLARWGCAGPPLGLKRRVARRAG